MIEKLINIFKKLFGKEEVLKIEASKEKVKVYQENISNSNDDRSRLLNIQEEIKSGNISEKDLKNKDINLLKELYCEQILELANSVVYYTKKINA